MPVIRSQDQKAESHNQYNYWKLYILPATTSVLLNQNVSSCKNAPTTAKCEKKKRHRELPRAPSLCQKLPKMKWREGKSSSRYNNPCVHVLQRNGVYCKSVMRVESRARRKRGKEMRDIVEMSCER